MSSIWDELNIQETQEESLIKRAYAKILKKIDIESNPDQFMKLRSAYEEALEFCYVDDEIYNELWDDEEYEVSIPLEKDISEQKRESTEFSKIDELVNKTKNFIKENGPEESFKLYISNLNNELLFLPENQEYYENKVLSWLQDISIFYFPSDFAKIFLEKSESLNKARTHFYDDLTRYYISERVEKFEAVKDFLESIDKQNKSEKKLKELNLKGLFFSDDLEIKLTKKNEILALDVFREAIDAISDLSVIDDIEEFNSNKFKSWYSKLQNTPFSFTYYQIALLIPICLKLYIKYSGIKVEVDGFFYLGAIFGGGTFLWAMTKLYRILLYRKNDEGESLLNRLRRPKNSVTPLIFSFVLFMISMSLDRFEGNIVSLFSLFVFFVFASKNAFLLVSLSGILSLYFNIDYINSIFGPSHILIRNLYISGLSSTFTLLTSVISFAGLCELIKPLKKIEGTLANIALVIGLLIIPFGNIVFVTILEKLLLILKMIF